MDELEKEDLKQLVLFYKQKSAELEFNLLCLQLQINKDQNKTDNDTAAVLSE